MLCVIFLLGLLSWGQCRLQLENLHRKATSHQVEGFQRIQIYIAFQDRETSAACRERAGPGSCPKGEAARGRPRGQRAEPGGRRRGCAACGLREVPAVNCVRKSSWPLASSSSCHAPGHGRVSDDNGTKGQPVSGQGVPSDLSQTVHPPTRNTFQTLTRH